MEHNLISRYNLFIYFNTKESTFADYLYLTSKKYFVSYNKDFLIKFICSL